MSSLNSPFICRELEKIKLNGHNQSMKKKQPITSFTADNWGKAPFNRASFQQVQQLFPTARVGRGAGPIYEFTNQPRDFGDLKDITYTAADGGIRSVQQMLEDSYTDSFLVVKNNRVLYEQYFGTMAADSLHLLNSVTKSLTGMLACIIAEQGHFDMNDSVIQYVPELAHTSFAKTSIRHLLDMTAAPKYGEDYSDPDADFWVETAVVGWRPALLNAQSKNSLLAYAQSLEEAEQLDGEKYHYRTVLTNVLGMVIERATGDRTLQNLLYTELWSKLGPEQDLAIVVDKTGFPYVGAGGNACTRDLARFGQMILNQGELNGKQIVPAKWIEDTRYGDATSKTLFAASDYGKMLPGGHYRNQTWVQNADQGAFFAIGIHGQTIHVNMSTGVVIVKLSSHPESADNRIFQDTFMAIDALSAAV